MNGLLERFLEYVKVDSQSDPNSNTSPSTARQKDMAKKLVMELYQLGMADVTIDDFGYIMATLPANTKKPVATIGFIAHYDTSPDYNGTGVNPQVHKDYNGETLLINEQLDVRLRPEEFPELNQYKGQTLITTDGTRKFFFRSWIGMTLWSDFTNQDIALIYLSTNSDDTVFVLYLIHI